MTYWNVIRPIDDPFWAAHKPGDRWGCKCSLEATDEPITQIPEGSLKDQPAPGLDNNPVKDGALFGKSHPYYPKNCTSCPFHSGDTSGTPKNKVGDCTKCGYMRSCLPKDTDNFKCFIDYRKELIKNSLCVDIDTTSLSTGHYYQSKSSFVRAISHAVTADEAELYSQIHTKLNKLKFGAMGQMVG